MTARRTVRLASLRSGSTIPVRPQDAGGSPVATAIALGQASPPTFPPRHNRATRGDRQRENRYLTASPATPREARDGASASPSASC